MWDTRIWSPGSGRSPGGEHGNPLQYSCLENPTDGGAWLAAIHRVAQNWTQLKRHTHKCLHAGGRIYSWAHLDGLQNPFPWSCRSRILVFLLAIGQGLSLATGRPPMSLDPSNFTAAMVCRTFLMLQISNFSSVLSQEESLLLRVVWLHWSQLNNPE